MYVTSGHDTEIRLTLEALVDLVNALADQRNEATPADVRGLLDGHGFTRAATTPATLIERVEARVSDMADTVQLLGSDDPTATSSTATSSTTTSGTATSTAVVSWINERLAELEITPSLTAHDGAGLHIHWTTATAAFDEQVIADFLMALGQEICDHGTMRFGICGATDCNHLFYDATRNGSRRFCSNPRCASRTHTAAHRARHESA